MHIYYLVRETRNSVKLIRAVESVRLLFVISLVIATAVFGCAEQELNYHVDYTAPNQFPFGAEDVLVVTVWKNPDLSREVTVRPDGRISLPLIGDVPAASLTADALTKKITERLSEFMASPIVTVQLKEVNSYFIYVLGEVTKPGKYSLKSYANVMQGISLAGGFTPFAKKNKIKVLRVTPGDSGEKKQAEIPVHYDRIVAGSAKVGNFFLQAGDVIVVP